MSRQETKDLLKEWRMFLKEQKAFREIHVFSAFDILFQFNIAGIDNNSFLLSTLTPAGIDAAKQVGLRQVKAAESLTGMTLKTLKEQLSSPSSFIIGTLNAASEENKEGKIKDYYEPGYIRRKLTGNDGEENPDRMMVAFYQTILKVTQTDWLQSRIKTKAGSKKETPAPVSQTTSKSGGETKQQAQQSAEEPVTKQDVVLNKNPKVEYGAWLYKELTEQKLINDTLKSEEERNLAYKACIVKLAQDFHGAPQDIGNRTIVINTKNFGALDKVSEYFDRVVLKQKDPGSNIIYVHSRDGMTDYYVREFENSVRGEVGLGVEWVQGQKEAEARIKAIQAQKEEAMKAAKKAAKAAQEPTKPTRKRQSQEEIAQKVFMEVKRLMDKVSNR